MFIRILLPAGDIVHEAFNRTKILIGNSPECDITIKDENISAQHCLVEEINGEIFVTDLASTNGVFLDEQRLPSKERTALRRSSQLKIAQFECLINSEGVPRKPAMQKVPPKDNSFYPKWEYPTTKVSSSPNKRFLPLIFVVMAIAYAYLRDKDHNRIQVKSPKENNVPEKVYQQKEQLKSCSTSPEYCHMLGLTEDKHEGVYLEDQELYVFMLPMKRINLPAYENIKKLSKRDDLIGIHTLLNSPLFERLQKDEFKQIHLILRNGYMFYTVYRFEAENFPIQGENKKILMQKLDEALESAHPDAFWKVSEKIYFKQNLD